ncbi:MAG TPA: hypothetical protein VGE52_20955, partial [Pirellulales bacterium]
SFKRRVTIIVNESGDVNAERRAVSEELQRHALKVSDVGFECCRKTQRCRMRFDVRLRDAAALHALTAALYDRAGVERVSVGRTV